MVDRRAKSPFRTVEPVRLARADRRDALIDAATELVASGDFETLSVEGVAERAGVSRPLVYKHFANRDELLAAVYARESYLLTRELSAAVNAPDRLEDKFRALIRGTLQAQANRGATLAALRAVGVRDESLRVTQRDRDRTTVRYFASLAVHDFGLDERQARMAVSILLTAMQSVLAQWRRHPTPEHAVTLEDMYAALVMGGLKELSER